MTNLIHTAPTSTTHTLTGDRPSVTDIVHRWHDENHTDPSRVCNDEPCRNLHEDRLGEAVREWHNDAHSDPWATCMEQPCHAVKTILHGRYALNVGLPL